jgi:hypothetical protein
MAHGLGRGDSAARGASHLSWLTPILHVLWPLRR